MGKFSSKRDKEFLIQGSKEENGDDEKNRERTRRNNKGANFSVHEGGLLYGKGSHLRVDCPEEDTCGPDGDEF